MDCHCKVPWAWIPLFFCCQNVARNAHTSLQEEMGLRFFSGNDPVARTVLGVGGSAVKQQHLSMLCLH